jgi:S-adenosylmethionine:tRNA ribosyltransferase-isomerase
MALLNINDYHYDLPQERIALYPLEKRDDSKLLIYQKGKVIHEQFHNISGFLPDNAFLFFNNTKVIPARLHFQKETGAVIEIFLLHPVKPSALLLETMQAKAETTWQCTIGNAKRWPSNTPLTKTIGGTVLTARLANKEQGIVSFQWNSNQSFAEIVDKAGETPLPPYLKRDPETSDRERYQTIYSRHEGAVAAPTAGLHFTDTVFADLGKKGVQHDFLTLHVSAGTFQPVKSENANDHVMHQEQIVVSKQNIENLLSADKCIIPVGTTSMRTIESIYWFGVKLSQQPNTDFVIAQEDPYIGNVTMSKREALTRVLDHMEKHNSETLIGETSIFIKPGYSFRVCDALVTNFHQPGSTLILLVAAFIGSDWKRVYNEALNNSYRFLSYGDSSLLMP